MAATLLHKVWESHRVRTLANGQQQLFIGLHLIHEVTTPQAFDMMRQHGWRVAFPERTFATIDMRFSRRYPVQRDVVGIDRRYKMGAEFSTFRKRPELILSDAPAEIHQR